MKKGTAKALQFEWNLIVLVTTALVLFGLVMVYSATSGSATRAHSSRARSTSSITLARALSSVKKRAGGRPRRLIHPGCRVARRWPGGTSPRSIHAGPTRFFTWAPPGSLHFTKYTGPSARSTGGADEWWVEETTTRGAQTRGRSAERTCRSRRSGELTDLVGYHLGTKPIANSHRKKAPCHKGIPRV